MSDQLFTLSLPRGALAWLLRVPIWLYHWHLGGLLGGRFLLLTHIGRKTGRPHQTVVEVIQHDRTSGTYYVVSGWGEKSSWYKNIMAHPRVTIQVKNQAFPVTAERITPAQGAQVILEYARQHPFALREISRIMNYPLDGSAESVMAFGRNIPIIAFRPDTPRR